MYSFIARHILARMLDLSRGTRTLQCLKELEESQWWPREKILELQNIRLRQLMEYAYSNVPYYRKIFDERGLKPNDIDSTNDLVRLPVLTKKIIRNNFDDMMACDFPEKELLLSRTGGSTGEPLVFYSTRNDRYNWGSARAYRSRIWTGYKIGDKSVVLTLGRPYGSPKEKFNKSSRRFFERTVIFNASETSDEKLSLLARKLERFRPRFVHGYPGAIYLLARYIEREGKPKIRPKAIYTGGEQLYDYQRDLFGRVFKCETHCRYSSWEVHNIADECPEHTGYHIAAENVIVEIADDEGKPVPVGREGRIILTNLHNYAMPFIRYDIGDVGAISDEACQCGRGLPLLTRLEGRSADVVFTRSGKSIPGTAIPWEFLASLGVEQFQIVQESYDDITVMLVVGNEYTQQHMDELTTEILGKYRHLFGDDMNITIEFADQIPLTEAGKRRVVISKISPASGAGSGPSVKRSA